MSEDTAYPKYPILDLFNLPPILNEITWSGLLNYIVLHVNDIFPPIKELKMNATNSSIDAATDARFLGLFLHNNNPNITRSLANFYHKSFSNRANLPATFVSFVGSA